MENTVYCLATSEPQADEILTHLRNLGFTSFEVSILLKDKKTKNISVKEDAIRGARKGAIVGGVLGAIVGATVLSIPAVMPLVVAGPFLAALEGAAAGGMVGGLAGGSGALTHVGIPQEHTGRVAEKIQDGATLIAVHSNDPVRLDRALRVFKSSGAEDIYGEEELAA
jgi:hypothetical protein